MSEFKYTLWKNKSGTQRQQPAATWQQFCKQLQAIPPAQVKDDCKLIKLATFGEERTPLFEKRDGSKSGGSLRHDANVLTVTGLEGDYDSEEMTPEKAIELLESCNVRAVIAPTFSSTPDAPRWRVLTPLAEPIKPSERLRYIEILNGMLGGELASESATLSQSYYVGVPAGADYNVLLTFGDAEAGYTLDELDLTHDLDQYRTPLRSKKSNDGNGGGDLDDTTFNDWVQQLADADAIHPALVRIAGHCVAKGFDDQHIRLLFVGLADRVRDKRGSERADLMLGKELDDAISSARAKGWEPRTFDEILADAKETDQETDPDELQKLVLEAGQLDAIKRRRVFETLKTTTKMPLSTFKEMLKESREGEEEDHLAMARRVVETIGSDNVIAAQGHVWHWDNAGVWKALEDRAVKQVVQGRIEDADDVTKSLVESVTDLFKTEIFSPDHEFDVGPVECVNTLNGELTLDNGQWLLMPANREHYRTTQIPVEYDPGAKAPRFIQFLHEVFEGDPDAEEKRRALLEMVGYSLMAHCRHERFIILVGAGANGKSVLLSVLEALLGSNNVAGVQPSQFDRSFQRAHLHGKLANIVTEIKQGEVIDDASLKGIVSGEPTTVEHKFKDPFVMRPFSTCWFGTNHMPHTRDFSDALFRRALVMEFNQTFKPELGNCDPMLKDKLLDELPGILNMALYAYRDALENGFTMPSSCKDARAQWRLEADQVAQFVEEACEPDMYAQVEPKKLFDAYTDWAADVGIQKRVALKSFSDRLVGLGYERKRTSRARFICGLKLQEGFSPPHL